MEHTSERCGDKGEAECSVVAVKVETSVIQSSPAEDVLVSILLRMVSGVGDVAGWAHAQPVKRKSQKSAAVAVEAVCCAVC